MTVSYTHLDVYKRQGLICVGGTTATHSLSDVFLLSLQKDTLKRETLPSLPVTCLLYTSGLAPNATVMSWRGVAGGIEAAKQKHDVIMTPNTYLYFDYYQTKDIANEPEAIGGYVPVETVYNYEPMPADLTPEEQKYIIGVQANLWTEYIPTYSQVEYMELPRMAALSEIQWTMPCLLYTSRCV